MENFIAPSGCNWPERPIASSTGFQAAASGVVAGCCGPAIPAETRSKAMTDATRTAIGEFTETSKPEWYLRHVCKRYRDTRGGKGYIGKDGKNGVNRTGGKVVAFTNVSAGTTQNLLSTKRADARPVKRLQESCGRNLCFAL